jgi:hypothetical protein
MIMVTDKWLSPTAQQIGLFKKTSGGTPTNTIPIRYNESKKWYAISTLAPRTNALKQCRKRVYSVDVWRYCRQ